MAHGAPDYSNVKKTEYSYRLDDLAELAARLNSQTFYDRRGEYLYGETFKDGFSNWGNVASGSYARVILDSTRYVIDGFSVLLGAGITDSSYCYFYNYLPYVSLQTIGFEFRMLVNEYVDWFKAEARVYTGTTHYDVYLEHRTTTGQLRVRLPNGSTTPFIENVSLASNLTRFSFFKIVADIENEKYLRAIINGTEYDLTDYGLYKPSSSDDPNINLFFYVEGLGTGNAEIFLDNVILTRNE